MDEFGHQLFTGSNVTGSELAVSVESHVVCGGKIVLAQDVRRSSTLNQSVNGFAQQDMCAVVPSISLGSRLDGVSGSASQQFARYFELSI